MSNFNSIFG